MLDKGKTEPLVGLAGGNGVTRRQFLARGAAFALAAAVTGPGLTLLSGCGGGGQGGSSSGPLSFWQFYGPGGEVPAQSKWFEDLVGAWNKENGTQIKLQYVPISDYVGGSKLPTAFSSGEGPDLFIISPGDFLRYYNGGVLQDLTPYVEEAVRKDFYPEVMSTRTVDGKIYGLPMEAEPLGMYYSVKAFEDAGLSEADVPKTWDQFMDVAERLKTDDMFGVLFETQPGYYQNFTWYPFMWMGGADAVSRAGQNSNFDSKGAVQALRFWQDTIKSGVAPRNGLGRGGGDLASNVAKGYCAMQEMVVSGVSFLDANAPDFEYGVFKLPTPSGGTYTTANGGWAFVANSKGKNPEEAAKFCAWALGSKEERSLQRIVDWCVDAKKNLPPRKAALEKAVRQGAYGSGPMKVFRDEVFPGSRGEPRYPPEVYKAVSDAIQACQLDGADPEQQAQQTAQKIDDFLKGYSGAAIV
jgi:multiple sugar transport system substrate-binding protein